MSQNGEIFLFNFRRMTELCGSQTFDELFTRAEKDPRPYSHIKLAGRLPYSHIKLAGRLPYSHKKFKSR